VVDAGCFLDWNNECEQSDDWIRRKVPSIGIRDKSYIKNAKEEEES